MIRTRTFWRNVSSKVKILPHLQLIALNKEVGKNSQFLSKLKAEYLDESMVLKKPLRNQYEMEYNARRLSLMTPEIYHEENVHVYNDIVRLLRELTPSDLNDMDIEKATRSYKYLHKHKTTVMSDIPPLPSSSSMDESVFQNYIDKLTSHKYLYRNASSQTTGIATPLIKHLFDRDNELVKYVRNVASYNMAILYFLKINDLDYALRLLKDMTEENIIPNTMTYNSFLYHLTFKKTKFSINPLSTTVKLLKEMKEKKIAADVVTWYMIMKISKKDVTFINDFLKVYKKLGLPSTDALSATTLDVLYDELSADEMIKIMNIRLEIPSSHLLHLVLRKLLDEGRVNDAWSTLLEKVDIGFRPNASTLQEFLDHFQEIELIQLSMGAFYTFQQRFNIKPTRSTSYSLMLVTTKTGYHANWRQMARIIYSEMKRFKVPIRNKAGYWITRLELRALTDHKSDHKKLNWDDPLSEREQKLLEAIKTKLVWGNRIITHPAHEKNNDEYNNICIAVGTKLIKNENPQHRTNLEDKGKREKYKRRIKEKNLGLNYLHKSKILAKKPVNFLADELESRGLVEDTEQLKKLLPIVEENDKIE